MIDYIQRRFDLKHTLASTIFGVLFGTIFGISIKSNFFQSNLSLCDAVKSFTFSWPIFTPYDIAVILIIIVLLIILFSGFRFISKEHSMMVDVAVKKILKSKDKLKHLQVEDYFVKEYFKKENNKNNLRSG